MADLTVDTTSPAYTTRHTQFTDIVGFYGPRLRVYFALKDAEGQKAWRQQDPFLHDILEFARKIEKEGAKAL